MSNVLRNPWLTTLTRKKLADGIAQRDGGTIEPGKVLDTIGPLGELQFPGDRFKPLQVIQFLSYDDPVTAVLSDKSATITCKFSSAAKSTYEASNGRMSIMKGGIIKPTSYHIHFLGVDGKLFWKGVTHEDQIAGEPISRKTVNRAKQTRRSNAESSESVTIDGGIGKTRINFPTPEPVLYIATFIFLGSEGSAVWGSPTSISLKTDVENLLKKLPRKIYTKEETPVGFGQSRQPVDTVAESPLQGKARTRAKSGNAARGTSKFSKLPKNAHDSDDEIRSQPEINGDMGEVSQLAFATQAPGRFSSTYDDLEFPTQANKEKKAQPKTTFSASTFPNSSQSTGHSPQVVIITKSRRGDPRQTKASVEKGKKHNGGPRLINYSDGTSLNRSTAGSVVGLKKMSGAASNRRRQEPEQHSPSPSEPGQLGVEAEPEKASAKGPRWGWQGMTEVTKEDAFIPKNQQELLDRPESWYPHQNSQNNQHNQYISGYSLVPKVQPKPKSHSPRNQLISHPTPIAPAPPRQLSPISSSEGEEIPWPSSPVRPSERDINAMPPDSSVLSGSQTYGIEIRRVGSQQNENPHSTRGASAEDSSSIPQQEPTLLRAGFSQKEISPVGSPSSTRESSEKEEMSGDVTMGKRVTRAANGISKKAPVDPNNVEPSRMARANQKLKVSVARKRLRPESESEEFSQESESSEDELINDPDLPFEVVNPNGRTRVDMFGGILKAQQVELWAKRKKTGCDSDENTEDSDSDEMQSGYGGHMLGEPINDSGKKGDVPEELVRETVKSFDMKSNRANDKEQVLGNIQDTDDHSHNPRSQEFRNDLVKIVTEEERPSEVVPPSYLSEAVEPLLFSEPNTAAPGVKDKAREPTPDSFFEMPVARPECINTDDEKITQAPPIPLNIMAGANTKTSGTPKHSPFVGRPTEVFKPGKITLGNKSQARDNNSSQLVMQPKVAPGNNLSTAAPLQTASTSALLDVHYPFGTPHPLPSSASNTAPTIQVEETPYRKGGPEMRNIESPSPTISKTRAALGYESDDITLIPATNTEELSNSSTSASFLTAQPSTPERDSSPPEAQVIFLDHIPSSAETGNLEAGPPGDFFITPQRQLQREMQQCAEIEVPATSETDRGVQCARPPPQTLSKARKPKRLTKSVDFQSQEIRAANARNVSSQLEKQKKEFLSLEREYDFESLDFQEDCPPPTNENKCKELEMEIPESLREAVRDSPAPTPVSPVRTYVLISSDDEDVAFNMSQSNTRKRHQPAPLNVPKPAKKLRSDEFTYGTSHSSPPILPPYYVAENRNKILTGSRNESSRTAKMESVEDKDEVEVESEPDINDLMAGFPAIHLPIDDVPESSWSSQIPSRPEIYAGIRERHLDVPGYGNLTDGQKKELDKRRQEYFGITPREGTKRLFSVELQRVMQAARPPLSLRQSKHMGAGELVANEWYRDENTPLKIFYRKFKELKQVKAELQGGTDTSGS